MIVPGGGRVVVVTFVTVTKPPPFSMSLSFPQGGQSTTTTGPENPLKEFSEEEKVQIKQATQNSEAAWKAWKDAQAAGKPKEEVDDLKDKAQAATDIEKGLQDLCD